MCTNPVFYLAISSMAQRHVAFCERHVALHVRHVAIICGGGGGGVENAQPSQLGARRAL